VGDAGIVFEDDGETHEIRAHHLCPQDPARLSVHKHPVVHRSGNAEGLSVLWGTRQRRMIAIGQFFSGGHRVSKMADEILAKIQIHAPARPLYDGKHALASGKCPIIQTSLHAI